MRRYENISAPITSAPQHNQRAFSIIETMVTLMIAMILTSMTVSNLKVLDNPLQDATAQTAFFLKESRARAISHTVVYKLAPSSSNQIVAYYGNTCATATTQDPSLKLKLPTNTSFSNTDWSLCFTPRGLSNSNLSVQIDQGAVSKTVEVMLGGGVRIL